MRYAWIILTVLIAGLLIGPFWSGNTGYVLIAAGRWTVETSIVAALIILLLLAIVLRYLWRAVMLVVRKTQWGMQWFGERRAYKAQQAFHEGAARLLNGEPLAAADAFGRSYGLQAQPLTATFAAYAAQQAGQLPLARDWLLKLNKPSELLLADTLFALQTNPDLAKQKLPILQQLLAQHPDHALLLKVTLQAYQRLKRWQDITQLLPQAQRLQCFSPLELAQLTEKAYTEVMREIGRTRADQLQPYWEKLSREQRRSAPIRLAYIKCLVTFGLTEAAGKLAARALKRQELKLGDLLERRLIVAEDELRDYLQDALKRHPDDGQLLHALGQIALQNKEHQLAARALRHAADVAPNKQVLLDLAQAYELGGDSQRALASYRQALRGQTKD